MRVLVSAQIRNRLHEIMMVYDGEEGDKAPHLGMGD